MRNLTAGNKMKFTMFTFIIIVILMILVGALVIVLKNGNEKYPVEKTAFMYDHNYGYIELENPALISKKWTGDYYLKEEVTNKEYNLGSNVVSYDVNKKNFELYGNFYQVLKGGDIKKLIGYNKISNSLENRFYKLDDRKYLIIGDEIHNDLGSLSMDNYIIIVIDKSGNALLLNNETNVKTINSIRLSTEDFTFDVANEKLIFNEEEINLKKIIGSTNEYVEKEKEETEDENQVDGNETTGGNENSSVVIADGSSTTITNSSTTNIESSKMDEELVTKLNDWAVNVKDAFNSIFKKEEEENKKEEGSGLSRSIMLNGVSSGSTYIELNYTVNDPENKYNLVYALISDGITNQSVSLNKKGNTYRIDDLEPNTSYTIEIGYKIVYSDATTVDTIEDSMVVRTTKQQEELSIVKVTTNNILFNLKLDGNYMYDITSSTAPRIAVYIDNKNEAEYTYRLTDGIMESATRSSGYTGSIEYKEKYKSAGSITIKLENTYYNGLPVSTNLKAKMINY